MWAQPLMRNTLRRFEILLPLRFNDGQIVPYELVGLTVQELRQHFNALTAVPRHRCFEAIGSIKVRFSGTNSMRVFVNMPSVKGDCHEIQGFAPFQR